MRGDVGSWCWMMTTQRLLQLHSTWLMASQCSILLNSAPRSRWAAPSLQRFGKARAGLARTNNLTRWWPGSGQCHHSWIWRWTWTWTDMDWEILVAWTKLIDGSYWLTIAKKKVNIVERIHCLWNSLCLGGFTSDEIECGNGLQLRVRTSPSAPLVQFLNISLRNRKNIIFAFVLRALKCLQNFSYS